LIGADATETSSNSTKDRRNVVATTGLFGGLDQLEDRLFESEGRTRETRQRVVVEFIGESVTTEQEPIAGERVYRYHVDGDRLFNANTSSELVTSRMHRRLFGRESTHAHPLFGDTVVLSQLTKRTVSKLVGRESPT